MNLEPSDTTKDRDSAQSTNVESIKDATLNESNAEQEMRSGTMITDEDVRAVFSRYPALKIIEGNPKAASRPLPRSLLGNRRRSETMTNAKPSWFRSGRIRTIPYMKPF